MSKAEFSAGHDGAKKVILSAPTERPDLEEVVKKKYSEKPSVISEEELAPSRAKFVAAGGQLPAVGASTKKEKPVNPAKTRGMVLPQEIKQKDADVHLNALHTILKTHSRNLSSHTDHSPDTVKSMEQANYHLGEAKAALNEAHSRKTPQLVDGKMMKFTSAANSKYQEASGHLLAAYGHLDAEHVRNATRTRKVSSGIPEREHVEELHKRVGTLRTLKPAKPFEEMKFGKTTIKGTAAMKELGQLAEEKGAPTPTKEKIRRAIKGTPRVDKFEKIVKGRGQQQLTKGDYTNPQRRAGRRAPIVGRGPMAQRKPGQTPGFEG